MPTTSRNEESIFAEALEKGSPEERAAYLDEVCKDDAALRLRVENLLRSHEQGGSFLRQPPPGTRDESVSENSGTIIGPYKLLQQIGEGGMGAVFMAEQEQPVRRRVALKIIKPGMDSKQVIARFEAERQALAVMDHPNIAKVFDAGTTATGRPYFVMELVKGVPITQYCDQRRLTPMERLELFLPVCQAVQHAHQKGIIHRDLKPSNVLLALYDGQPVPKVIDFGIAKATGPKLTERTLFTEFGQIVGTLEYMSPEQAELNQLDIDTRSDVYSLGVLLYELLTGTTPLEKKQLRDVAVLELLRLIREVEPPKPSARLSTTDELPSIAANRGQEPSKLSGLVRGELDWVVMKALEKDRNRRYETANSLALDLQRSLHDEPVQACPPSAVYRFRKFARRNKVLLATATVLSVAVLVALGGLLSTVKVLTDSNEQIKQEQKRTTDAWERETQAKNDLNTALERERQNSYYQRIALAEREWSANNLRSVEKLLEECPADLRGWEWRYLKCARYNTFPHLGLDGMVLGVAFSPDSQRIAACGQWGAIKIWEARTGREVRQIPVPEYHLLAIAFSPKGRYLAAAGGGFVRLWEADTGQEILLPCGPLRVNAGLSRSVSFSPDGQFLACAFGVVQEGGVKIWETATGRERRTLPTPTLVGRMQFSPDGRRIATGDVRGTLKLWDARTGDQQLTMRASGDRIASLAFSPDSRLLAVAAGDDRGYPDNEVEVWDTHTGQRILSLRGHVGALHAVSFSPDGQRLASAGIDQTIKLWDVATGRETITLRGHADTIWQLAFSPDGNQLASASLDHTVRIWDATPTLGNVPLEPLTLRGDGGAVMSVAFNPAAARQLATGYSDGTVKIWETSSGKEIHTFPSLGNGPAKVAFDSNGRRLAAGAGVAWVRADKTIRVWDVTTFEEICALPGHEGRLSSLAFSPDGRHLASAGLDAAVRVWDLTTSRQIQEIRNHKSPIHTVVFSPDGRQIASAGADCVARICDPMTADALRALEPKHAARIETVTFSCDGKLLASASYDHTVKVWDAKTWQLLHDLRDLTGVQSVAFSPDGRLLAWGSMDATVKIWDTLTKKETQTLRGHTGWIADVAFSPDGEWIASASLDGTVKLWPVPRVP